MENPERKDIFLSYSVSQKGFAHDLRHRLDSMGYSVFISDHKDDNNLQIPLPDLIFSVASICKLAIVVLSSQFFTSAKPILELCAFASRYRLQAAASAPSQQTGVSSLHSTYNQSFTLLPLFYELSPGDIKEKIELDGWRKIWDELEQEHQDFRISAQRYEWAVSKLVPDRQDFRTSAGRCEWAVRKLLPVINGIVRRPKSEQGEASYIKEVADKIHGVLPCRGPFTNPGKNYSGRVRLCNLILDKFRELESQHSSASNDNFSYVLGMYGVPGSGKSTISKFVCDSLFDDCRSRGNVFYLELPSELDVQRGSGADYLLLTKRLADLVRRFTYRTRTEIESMGLTELQNELNSAKQSHKMFLVLDNITTSNFESYEETARHILQSAIVGSGSMIMFVARSRDLLDQLFYEVEQWPKYKCAITEVPRLTEKEAMEIIRNDYSSITEDLMNHYFSRSSLEASSSMHIPLVLEEVGALLREKPYFRDFREVEKLWKMVNVAIKGKIHEETLEDDWG